MTSGRRPGYKHSQETKEKMRQSHIELRPGDNTKDKMRQSKLGVTRSEAERKAIAVGRAFSDLETKCMHRFLEMRSEYPGYEEFFDTNQQKLLLAMRDVKSETELRDIRRYIETTHLEDAPQACLRYQYDSSSIFAHEEAMVDLCDASAELRKELSTKICNVVLH